jgi:hypothetical protein
MPRAPLTVQEIIELVDRATEDMSPRRALDYLEHLSIEVAVRLKRDALWAEWREALNEIAAHCVTEPQAAEIARNALNKG